MFDFTAEDLKFNQRGQLSAQQREWLKNVAHGARSFSWTGARVTIGFASLGICMILGLSLQNEDTRAAFSDPMYLIVFPIIVFVVGAVVVLSIALAYWNAHRLENAILLSVTGNTRLEENNSSKGGTTYYGLCGEKTIRLCRRYESCLQGRGKVYSLLLQARNV